MFKVVKRDGCWWVLDRQGRLRYAAGSHRMALAFALIQPQEFPTVKGDLDPHGKRLSFNDLEIRDAVRRAIENRIRREEE